MCTCNRFGSYDDSIHSPSSKVFMMKAIILLTIICLPGNLITSILVYSHWTSDGNSKEDKSYSSVIESKFSDIGLDDEVCKCKLCYILTSTNI